MTKMNIQKIADMTGVSKTTVSRVINQEKYVSSEIREKVLRVIEETGYVPNGNAINLSKGKSNTIGVTLPYNNLCYQSLINSILDQANLNGQKVLLLPTYHEEKIEFDYFSLLEQKTIDSLILTTRTSNIEAWEALNMKGKIISTEKLISDKIPMIYSDRQRCYELLFAELKNAHDTDIVFTVQRGVARSQSTFDKVKAFEMYFGKAIEGRDYYTNISGYEIGKEWVLKTFSNKKIPEVFYINGDDTAAGVLKGLEHLGYQHNHDFLLIGEGNTTFSEVLDFSTIDFTPQKIGEEVVNFVCGKMAESNKKYEPKIIWRLNE
ncbi:LacI family DNA-binding transcriptional regulator [Vagococcus silagei]|nr:LacI family DNA-binding transcriptional regulator [Vagococcus silagei]